jgi:hypothetical protein
LFELIPPTSTPTIGGARFLQMEKELSRSSEQHELNLPIVSTVHGYFSSKCQFEATLTPEQQSYGLSASSFVVRTAPVVSSSRSSCPQGRPEALVTDAQELAVNVPQGTYSVYLRPVSGVAAAADAGAGTCDAIPAALLPIEVKPGISPCVTLALPAPQKLDVQIPWPEAAPKLDGWTVDIVHPTTGQLLSRSARLGKTLAPIDSGRGYQLSVDYSPLPLAGAANSRQELFRLSPPPLAANSKPGASPQGPVIQLGLAALVASSPVDQKGVQKALVPALGPFPRTVRVASSVFDDVDFSDASVQRETPVPGTLTFTATKLDALPDGVFASFTSTAVVGDDGQVVVDLLPGKYRVRIVPSFDPVSDRHFAAQETIWSVGASDAATQAGRVIRVKRASSIVGRAVSVLGGTIDGAAVQALPGSVGTRQCTDPQDSTCTSQPVGVLERALAEAGFVPRSAAAVTHGGGKFTVQDIDCGDCDSSGAIFDVTVQPADGSRLPWAIRPGIVVASSAPYDLQDVQTPLPIIQRGTVQVPQAAPNPPIPVPGTLISAYLLRDASGAPIFDPTGLPSCATGTYTGTEGSSQCIRSALQVAETRADAQGNYELVLPASIDAVAR